jgi:hypothetical protein
MKKEIKQKIKEEKKIKVAKFTRPEIVEELTEGNIKDIIQGQENEIENLSNEIKRKKECVAHYKKALK